MADPLAYRLSPKGPQCARFPKRCCRCWRPRRFPRAYFHVDPKTGNRAWTHRLFNVTDAGMLTTATNLVFSAGREGYFFALDGKTGKTSGRSIWAR